MSGRDVAIELCSEQDTRRLGRQIARRAQPGDVIVLTGELGAGKTTLTQGLVEELGGSEATSPTFALCHRYETTPPVAHVDCWRVAAPAELDDLALDELVDDGWIIVAEWGDLLLGRYDEGVLEVELQRAPGGRVARLHSGSARWAAELSVLGESMERPC